jgi:hypothetical protein
MLLSIQCPQADNCRYTKHALGRLDSRATPLQGPTKMEELLLITVSCLECGNTVSVITLVGNTDQYSFLFGWLNIGRYFLQG